jgi:hypothetical protein
MFIRVIKLLYIRILCLSAIGCAASILNKTQVAVYINGT